MRNYLTLLQYTYACATLDCFECTCPFELSNFIKVHCENLGEKVHTELQTNNKYYVLMRACFVEALIIFSYCSFLAQITTATSSLLKSDMSKQLHGTVRRSGLSLVSSGNRAYVITLIMSMQLLPPSSIIYLIGCFQQN